MMTQHIDHIPHAGCLDHTYSTTGLVTCPLPVSTSSRERKGVREKTQGGLRTRGLFKQSLPDKPLITVVTVVFNGAAHVERAIKSVISQAYDSVEFLIVDGGSSDGTVDILRRYDEQIDYWVSEPDAGIYDAINKGILLSRGRWVYVLGSDDVLLESLAFMSSYLKEDNHIYYGAVVNKSSGRIRNGKFNLLMLLTRNIPHQALFYPRQVFEKFTYDTKYALLADYALNLMLYSNKAYKFRYVAKAVAVYDDVAGLSSTTRDLTFSQEKSSIIKECFPKLFPIYALCKSVKHGVLGKFRPTRGDLKSVPPDDNRNDRE